MVGKLHKVLSSVNFKTEEVAGSSHGFVTFKELPTKDRKTSFIPDHLRYDPNIPDPFATTLTKTKQKSREDIKETSTTIAAKMKKLQAEIDSLKNKNKSSA